MNPPTTSYEKLGFIIQTLKSTNELSAFYMGAIQKFRELCDDSSIAFTDIFAQLVDLDIITPEVWYSKEPNYALRCNFEIKYPPQPLKLDIDIFQSETQLFLANAEEKAFLLAILSEVQDQGVLIFNVSKMPQSWELIKTTIPLSEFTDENLEQTKQAFFTKVISARMIRRLSHLG
jgi:hypothetical protein